MSKTQTIDKIESQLAENKRIVEKYVADQKAFFESNFLIAYGIEGSPCYVCAHCGKQYQTKPEFHHLRTGRLVKCMREHIEKKHHISSRYINYRFLWENYPHESAYARALGKLEAACWMAQYIMTKDHEVRSEN